MPATDNSIFLAAVPTPYRVLGLKLKPFSLGHYMLLRRFGCAFVSDEQAAATREDLIFAVAVCSQDFDEFEKWLDSPPMSKWERVKAFGLWCVRRIPFVALLAAIKGNRLNYDVIRWGRGVGPFDLNEKAKLFQNYLSEHSVTPKYIEERETRSTGAHWAHSVFSALTSACGFDRHQALTMSLREAFMHVAKYAENNGSVTLMTDEEIAFSES